MLQTDGAEERRILQERAKILARPDVVEAADSADEIYVVQFLVAGQSYAFDGSMVREVSPCKQLTRIPCTPRFIAGVVNVRSEIIPVLDIRNLFQLPAGWPNNCKLIVLQSADTRLGVLADDVIGVTTLSLARLQPPLPNMTPEQTRYMRGLADGPIIFIDAQSLIDDPQIAVNETVD